MKRTVHLLFTSAIFLLTMVLPIGAQDQGWDFVYNGDRLPEDLVKSGAPDWKARTNATSGSDEVAGMASYESILHNNDAEVGGIWSRMDDNSVDPVTPSNNKWARGYLFGTDVYSKWSGEMTLVLRIKDLGTDNANGKSVVDLMNTKDGDFWTLGQAPANASGSAGWNFGQTQDRTGSVGRGLTDLHAGGFNQWVIIRINVIDQVPGDGKSRIMAWQDSKLVYDTVWKGDISVGEFREIAFRRTSGGNSQKMEIDWVRMSFQGAYPPGKGPSTPNGMWDSVPESGAVTGALGMDTYGIIRSYSVPGSINDLNPLFAVDQNGVPTQFNLFFMGFDVYRDFKAIANDQGTLSGVLALDKYAWVHRLSVDAPYLVVSGAWTMVSGAVGGPSIEYDIAVRNYNLKHPGDEVDLPFYGPYTDPVTNQVTGDINFDMARALEPAVDWRQATNAFQGYYILDAFAGVHYINNPEVMALLQKNPGQAGADKFFDVFGFRNNYLRAYGGKDATGNIQIKEAPYFYFSKDSYIPIARDLKVMVRFEPVTGPLLADSLVRNQKAKEYGIDASQLYEPIAISPDRLDENKPVYTQSVAITNGYTILDGYGGVHTMLEDKNGVPIPAPWENPDTGQMDPSVNAPYFASPPFDQGADDLDIAVKIAIMPNGEGYCLLTRLGEVFVVNAIGKTAADNFVEPGIEQKLPVFGFDAARDLKLVSNKDGKIIGIYVLDCFGTIHSVGQVPKLPSEKLFFPSGYSQRIELSPYMHQVTAPYMQQVTGPY